MKNLASLPANLPVPIDDGAAQHLTGSKLAPVFLRSTAGIDMDLHSLKGLTVLYIYPMTGKPGVDLPAGWDQIPGARGCTPQSCAFRDHSEALRTLGARIYGVSTQDTPSQKEAKERLHLPFDLLSDSNLLLAKALKMPSFEVDGMTLYRRITLICRDITILKTFYPVFPPDQNAAAVVDWLKTNMA